MIDETMEVDMDSFIESVTEDDKNTAQESVNRAGFQFPTTVGIGQKAIVRFIYGIPATPLDTRFSNPYVAKLVNIAWIKDDEGKPMRLILPAIINYKSQTPSTLFDFCEAVMTKSWVNFTDAEIAARQSNPNLTEKQKKAKGEFKFFFKDRDDYGPQQHGSMKLKDIFLKVYKCDADPNGMYYNSQKSWEGQTVYIANVIDRLDPEWHSSNKKAKLLMGKVELKNGKLRNKEASWFRMSSIADFAKTTGSKMNYDVMITPSYSQGKELTSSPYLFNELSSRKEKDYWSGISITDAEKAKVHGSELTAEEKEYELIDISSYYKLTSAQTIEKRLIKTIDAFDLMTGNNFGARIRAEAEAERAAAKAAKENKATETTTSLSPSETPVIEPVAPVAPVAPSTSAQPAQPAQPTPEANPYGFAPVKPASDFNPEDFYKNM